MNCRHFAFALLAIAAWSIPSLAQETAEKPAEAAKPAAEANELSPSEIDKLIEQLDANRFSERQAAQQKLQEAGKAAFPALEKATQSISREVATRAMDVLKKQYEGSDDATKAAAKQSLERLAKNQDTALAKRAGDILNPPKPQSQQPPLGVPGRIGGNIQIQVQAIGGANGFKKMSVKDVNGVKETEVEENGRKVKITDDPANGIKLEVTEKKDGKETTQKYEAKDAAELKTKHPEAHKLFEEYSKQPAGIQIRAIPGGVLPPGIPGIPAIPAAPGGIRAPRLKILRPDDLSQLQEKAEATLKEIQEAARLLKEAKPGSDDFKKAQDKLDAAQKLAEELKAKLGE